MGLRLQLHKAQAEAGDIILLYGDESEALTHPYLARASDGSTAWFASTAASKRADGLSTSSICTRSPEA
jgi:hypothetical protein